MLKVGTGWLGWTEEQTLATNMNTIVLAYNGRVEMLKACFGSSDDTPSKPKRKPTAKELKTFAKTHNAVTKTTRKK